MSNLDFKILKKEEEEISEIKEEEIEGYLSNNALADFLRIIGRHKVPTASENLELYHKAIKGDLVARNLLIEKNIRLVFSVAYKYRNHLNSYELIDVVQDGILGLMDTIERYDENLGASFSSYAIYRIKSAIVQGIIKNDNTIPVPLQFKVKQKKYFEIYQECIDQKKDLPTDAEWRKILNVSLDMLENIKKGNIWNCDSLNRIIKTENEEIEKELGELIGYEDDNYNVVINNIDDNELFLILKKYLNPIHYYVLYHTVLCDSKKTLDWVGKNLGVTRERTRQLREDALSKLKDFYENDTFYMTIFKEELRNVSVDDYCIEPIEPNNIFKYLYVKDFLNEEERFILKTYLFGENKDYIRAIQKKMDLDSEAIKKRLLQILTKAKSILMQDKTWFEEFKTNLKKAFKIRVLVLNLEMEVNEYLPLPRKTFYRWQDKTYNDFLDVLATTNLDVSYELEWKIKQFLDKNEIMDSKDVNQVIDFLMKLDDGIKRTRIKK